jgi:O-antigen ligase
VINANSLAVCAGVVALFALNRFIGRPVIRQKLLYGALFATNFATMLFAQSRTCVVAFMVALLIVFSRKRFKYLLIGLFIAVPLIGIYDTTSFEEGMGKYFRRGQSERQFRSWSGRLTAWEYSWDKFKESPVLGYGMEAGVRFGAVSKELQGSHLHSSYFETLINSGLIGFIPWLVCLVIVAKGMIATFAFFPKWFDTTMRDYHTELTAIFVFLLVRTFAGTTFVRFDYLFMMYLALIGYVFAVKRPEKREEPAPAAALNPALTYQVQARSQEKIK